MQQMQTLKLKVPIRYTDGTSVLHSVSLTYIWHLSDKGYWVRKNHVYNIEGKGVGLKKLMISEQIIIFEYGRFGSTIFTLSKNRHILNRS